MSVETQSVSPLSRSIAWLGRVPDHWGIRRLKYLVAFSGGGTPSKAEPSFWGGDIPWVSPKDMKSEVIENSADHITDEAVRASATRMVPAGAVLLVVRSGILRHTIPVAITARPVALNQDMKALIPTGECESRFLKYVIQGRQHVFLHTWTKSGATVESIEHELLANTPFPVPPLEEQRAIADYLDEKTAGIDALIAKRERHIQLLEEERQAVIARIVTRGLGTDAGYHDSGLPWIGAVPQHWRVAELRRAWDVVDCKHRTPTYVEEGYPLVSTTEVKPGRLDLRQTTRFVGDADFADMTEGPRRPQRGDIIYSRNASLGSAAYVDTDEPFCMGQDVVLITSDDQDQLFLSYVLNSWIVGAQVERMSIGSTFNRINVSQIRSLIVPIPPREEQHAIASCLDVASARMAKTVSRIREQIEKLREYRQTLISASVTGQIPVREEVPA